MDVRDDEIKRQFVASQNLNGLFGRGCGLRGIAASEQQFDEIRSNGLVVIKNQDVFFSITCAIKNIRCQQRTSTYVPQKIGRRLILEY